MFCTGILMDGTLNSRLYFDPLQIVKLNLMNINQGTFPRPLYINFPLHLVDLPSNRRITVNVNFEPTHTAWMPVMPVCSLFSASVR